MRSGIKRSAAGVLRKRIPEITAARGTAEAPASGAPEDSGLFRGSENCGGQVSFGRQGTVPMPFGLFGIHNKPAALGRAGMGQVNAAPGTAAGKGCRRLRAGENCGGQAALDVRGRCLCIRRGFKIRRSPHTALSRSQGEH